MRCENYLLRNSARQNGMGVARKLIVFRAPLFLTAFATMAPQVQSEAHGRPTTAGLLHQIW